jgi:anti-sigma-K factor RskA
MNLRNLQRNDRLREQLAAGYVLGTLKGGARRRFERWLAMDRLLEQSVTRWENRLGPLAEFTRPIEPPERVWQGIEQQLRFHGAPAQAPVWRRLRNSLSFWRGLSFAASALAAVLAAVLVLQPHPQGTASAPAYIALLTSDNEQTVVAVSGGLKRITVRVVGVAQVAADHSLELWAVPAQGAPQSLGLLIENGAVTLALPENVTPQTMPVLAVSLEPKGGSPNPRAPSGPILYKGGWVRI